MRRTKEEAARTRDRIVDAAEHAFYESGYASATLTDIAAGARLTRGAIHFHFASKAELLHAVLRGQVEELLGPDLRGISTSRRPTLDDVERVALHWLDGLTVDPARRRRLAILERTTFIDDLSNIAEAISLIERQWASSLLALFDAISAENGLGNGWKPRAAAAAVFFTLCGIRQTFFRDGSVGHDPRSCIRGLFETMSSQQTLPHVISSKL